MHWSENVALRILEIGRTHADAWQDLSPTQRVNWISSPRGAVSYTYELNGRRATLTLPSVGSGPRVVTYGYDPATDDLASVTDWTAAETNFTDDGTITTTYDNDHADQLQEIDSVDLFDYDGNGNRISYGSNSYSYDWANRLTGATASGTSSSYAYLGAGAGDQGQGARRLRLEPAATRSSVRRPAFRLILVRLQRWGCWE